jgi:hypothetical protein
MRSKCRTSLVAVVALSAVAVSGMVSVAPAFASGKPFVETKPATSIAENSATLNGVVNPNGAETKYYFEYGKTTSYGSKTTEVSLGSGTSNLEESRAITGLAGKTAYHFRIVATNTNGTSDGADEEFSTKQALPEWQPIINNAKITIKLGAVNFTNASGTSYGCKSGSGEATITGNQSATATLHFTTCQGGEGPKCHSKGAEEGEIVTSAVPVELVYLSKAKHEAGLVFNYNGGTFAEWTCHLTEGLGIRHSIVVPITPVNKSQKTYTLTFAQSTHGVQNPRKYENAEGKEVIAFPEVNLLGGFYEEGSLTGIVELTWNTAIEVKA